MNEDFFRNIFKCCLYIALSAFVLIATYATLDLVVDGMDYREKRCVLNSEDPLGLKNEVKAPDIPITVKNATDFRAWMKTLTQAQRAALKAKYVKEHPLNSNDPLGLLTDPVTGEVRSPAIVNRMKEQDFIEWFKTLPKAKRDAVKEEYLRIITKYSE
jgi:hypothetical protein